MYIKYYMVEESAVADSLKSVVKIKSEIQRSNKSVTEACREEGIARATYYKYRDKIYEQPVGVGNTIDLLLTLENKVGALSGALEKISAEGLNVVTIFQGLPRGGYAVVGVTLEVGSGKTDVRSLCEKLKATEGVFDVKTKMKF